MDNYSNNFRRTIVYMWAAYTEAIEHGEYITADSISATIRHMEKAELRAVQLAYHWKQFATN